MHGTRRAQQFHRHHGVLACQHLVKLVPHAFLSNNSQALHVAHHPVVSVLLNLPTIARGKADAAQDAQRVVVVGQVGGGGSAYHVVPDVVYALARDVHDLARRDIGVEGVDGEVAAHAVFLDRAESRLGVAAGVVDVLLLAGLHELQFHVGEGLEVEHGRTVIRIDGDTLHGIPLVAQPLGKAYAARGQAHAQVDVLNLAAHQLVAHTAPHGIDVAFPLRTFYQFT